MINLYKIVKKVITYEKAIAIELFSKKYHKRVVKTKGKRKF